MIQPLRSLHRYTFRMLAIALPAILLTGLGARHPRQVASAVEMPASAYLVREADDLWRAHAIRSEFYGDREHPQQTDLRLAPVQDLGEPDLLLYWSNSEPKGNALPPDARLMGPLAPNTLFALPQNGQALKGHLVLYSLAHQTVIDSATLENMP